MPHHKAEIRQKTCWKPRNTELRDTSAQPLPLELAGPNRNDVQVLHLTAICRLGHQTQASVHKKQVYWKSTGTFLCSHFQSCFPIAASDACPDPDRVHHWSLTCFKKQNSAFGAGHRRRPGRRCSRNFRPSYRMGNKKGEQSSCLIRHELHRTRTFLPDSVTFLKQPRAPLSREHSSSLAPHLFMVSFTFDSFISSKASRVSSSGSLCKETGTKNGHCLFALKHFL